MARSNHASLPPPPQPTRILFDPYNSTSTGHQTAPSRLSGSTSWRQSRSHKRSHQFRDATGGGGRTHLSDLVGAGSENWRKDGKKDNGDWEDGAPGLREQGWQDIRRLLGNTRKRSRDSAANSGASKQKGSEEHLVSSSKRRRLDNSRSERRTITTASPVKTDTCKETEVEAFALVEETLVAGENMYKHEREHENDRGRNGDEDEDKNAEDISVTLASQIFKGLNIYLNGSTAPLISDHKLKQLFTRHGGNTSIALGRRTVTHVILGEKCGGGLASGKIQKENATVRGKGIKYVTAQWVLDSIEKGIRQPESRYAVAEVREKLGGSRQRSVAVLFGRDGG